MTKVYNLTRVQAGKILWVSTRTIDRYVKSWKLSYKKIANKVLLSNDDVSLLKQSFSELHKNASSEIVSWNNNSWLSLNDKNFDEILDKKLEKFILIFKEKDNILEEKNKIIFMLQKRVSELETKINQMVALPDYTKEKQEALLEKQKLENKITLLNKMVKTEKSKNMILVWLALVFIWLAAFLLLKL